jgi:phytoene dehydrogenase-like protein
MAGKEYDAIVIGAGVGGCGVAALLAKDFGKKVLLLEKAPHIGGRVASYTGKGDKVTIDGLELDSVGFQRSLANSRSWLTACEPDIGTIFKKGLLDGYTFEIGGHGLFWGNKSRCSLLLDHLDESIDMPLNKGLGYVDAEKNAIYQVQPRQPNPWQTQEGYKATLSALKQMGGLSRNECASAMAMDVHTWWEQRGLTGNKEAYDYLKMLMAGQNAIAEPRLAPAGDFLAYMAMARDIGMNFHTGSAATITEPGCIAIALAMETALKSAGGEVQRNTPVEEVIVEGGKAKGVIIRNSQGKYESIEAPIVVCNIPPKHIFNVLHPRHFPAEWVDLLQNRFWSPGILSAFIGLKNNVWQDYGLDERSFIWMPGIIKGEGYIGDVDAVMWSLAACARRAPEGKRDFAFSIALTDKEMRSPQKVMRIINYCMDWFKKTFKGWKENLEFVIWTPSDEAYGNWRPVGEKRPDVKSPHLEGLFFVGDQYGERLWGGGVDAAALSVLLCTDSIMGTDLEHEILPPYHCGFSQDI